MSWKSCLQTYCNVNSKSADLLCFFTRKITQQISEQLDRHATDLIGVVYLEIHCIFLDRISAQFLLLHLCDVILRWVA
jgi:hypothetical protein